VISGRLSFLRISPAGAAIMDESRANRKFPNLAAAKQFTCQSARATCVEQGRGEASLVPAGGIGHLLLGGAHFSAHGFGNSSFSMALGGGIDATVVHDIRWRVIQMDYLLTQFGGGSQNNLRISTGIILRF